MGARKRISAENAKEEKSKNSFASLRNCPTSPRKMRLVTDMIRGMEVNKALNILKFSKKDAAIRVEKLLLSAIANWQAKNEGVRLEDSELIVSEVFVDSARILKRLRPAPQGRAHRIRKRSNHVTLYVDSKVTDNFDVDTDIDKENEN
ncbi:MAG: 50S ribosomal protein L22 [Bacteroidales bacterium]|nr:50S ribosomal protein L22 [Bacteroidales bacterium]MCF8454875.1 50S ribosomal protein L22 [Bacteroidales bacterium]